MGLRDISLKPAYDSSIDDILNDFYIPVLSNSIYYKRLAGFFSSDSLAIAARGISRFIHNKGNMRIIASVKLNKSDIEAIIRGIKEPLQVIEEASIRSIENITDEFIKDHINALAWMVANNMLEIKIAARFDRNILDSIDNRVENILSMPIFHQKIGVLEDKNGDMISFSGSINETASGWLYNIEEFKVFRKWIGEEMKYVEIDNKRFEDYWEGRVNTVNIYDIPTALKQRLIKIIEDNNITRPTILEKLQQWERKLSGRNNDVRRKDFLINRNIELRDYQIKAINSWIKYGRGFIEMATGTGKTYVALGCIKELERQQQYLIIIISVPFIHLIDQWVKNLLRWGYNYIVANSAEFNWYAKLANRIDDLNKHFINKLIIITTHDTLSDSKFINIISEAKVPILLIADEVHGLGSPERRKGLLDSYTYRIGLSATPRRWFDEEGTNFLFDYFGKTVFSFSLHDAIRQGYLTPYYYYPHFIELTEDEFAKYLKYTKVIAGKYKKIKYKNDNNSKESSEQPDEIEQELLTQLLNKRRQIIVNAKKKFDEFAHILDTEFSPYSKLKRCLIYCSPQQIDRVQDILNKRGIIQHRFTAEEDREERQKILDNFVKGNYHALVAMRCLDEGVDIPSAETAFILASSTNPREFIQRRGRILRLHEDKKYSYIYDFVVIPTFDTDKYDNIILNLEGRIVKNELERVREFASSAENHEYALAFIDRILSIYNK
ncbi:MAG: DEAD/DEAH box helicase family protein [Candidatus Nitrosocaldaceae archaeon]